MIDQFFKEHDGQFSMTRLLVFLSYWPATYILILNATSLEISNLLGIYLGAFVLGYIGGKGASCFQKREVKPDVLNSD